MVSLKASQEGLNIIDKLRCQKYWSKTDLNWYHDAYVSKATLKRFWAKTPISKDNFISICQVVGCNNWQDIVDNTPDLNSEAVVTWHIKLDGNLDRDNILQTALEVIELGLREDLNPFLGAEISLTIKKIKQGSLILVLSSSREIYEWVKDLFESGDITKLLGFNILSIELETIPLSQWIDNNFTAAIEAGWQSVDQVLGQVLASPRLGFAFRANLPRLAKKIELADYEISLIIDITVINQEISVWIGVHPINPENLPENLQLFIFFESGEIEEISLNSDDLQGFSQEILLEPGEHFEIQLSLDHQSIVESFIV